MYVLGIKPHMGLHFPDAIRQLGSANCFDMSAFERNHKPLKVVFKGTSQRLKSTNIEIIARVERRAVIADALRAMRDYRGVVPSVRIDRTHRSQAYSTEDNIVFRASTSSETSLRVLWNHRTRVFETRGGGEVAFINPVVTLHDVSRFLESEICSAMTDLGKPFRLGDLKRNSTACQLLLVRSYKVESTSQGIPEHSLVCNRAEVQVVGSRASRRRRFDWISINGNRLDSDIHTFFTTYIHYFL